MTEHNTWKSVGSDVSQLLVHPTVGLKRSASLSAKVLTISTVVPFVGFLISGGKSFHVKFIGYYALTSPIHLETES